MRLVAALAGATILVTGCNSVESLSYGTPPPTAATPTTAPPLTLPDTSGVALPAVAGVTTTTAPVATGGAASIRGTVLGPSGVVPGATVEADRIVGDNSAQVKATTGPDGGFTIAGLLGGRYRVRAWMAPTLAVTSPQIFFLGATQVDQISLTLSPFSGTAVVGVINPSPPTLNQPTDLAVQVTAASVGTDGVVRSPTVAGATVELTNGPGWMVLTTNPIQTSADGEATFEVECVSVGAQPLDAAVNGQVPQALTLPDCQPPPPPTTVPPSTLPATTTTTVFGLPGGGPGSTSTTSTTLGH
ncbi:MAG TPA: carboxypeptidase-like regulatory domain-containing protein [Acidimicrobiales bacterium]|nr:carboxypeptidase-like regulatory domain-containing protein [Acidimicrobiales bacterium]